MTDLTPYLNPPDQKAHGPLFIEDGALKQLTDELTANGAPEVAAPDQLGPLIAASTLGLLRSQYMQNPWFQRQSAHALSAFTLRDKEGEVVSNAVVHLVRRKNGPGYVMVSPSEHALPDSYYEERVIEETKVELGIT